MNAINSLIIEGNLVKNPCLKTTQTGVALCIFTVANNRFFRRNGTIEQETSFFEVETWAELAERCSEIGKQGSPIRIVGRIKQCRWEDADGKPCTSIRIVAEHVEFKQKKQIENEIDDLVEEDEPCEEAINAKTASMEMAI